MGFSADGLISVDSAEKLLSILAIDDNIARYLGEW
jgi:hypothetical protein